MDKAPKVVSHYQTDVENTEPVTPPHSSRGVSPPLSPKLSVPPPTQSPIEKSSQISWGTWAFRSANSSEPRYASQDAQLYDFDANRRTTATEDPGAVSVGHCMVVAIDYGTTFSGNYLCMSLSRICKFQPRSTFF